MALLSTCCHSLSIHHARKRVTGSAKNQWEHHHGNSYARVAAPRAFFFCEHRNTVGDNMWYALQNIGCNMRDTVVGDQPAWWASTDKLNTHTHARVPKHACRHYTMWCRTQVPGTRAGRPVT